MVPLRLADVVLYVIQVTLLVVAAHAAAAVLARRLPRVRVGYWRAVIAACAALPLLPATIGFTAGRQVTASFYAAADQVASQSAPTWPPFAAIIFAGVLVRLLWMGAGLRRLHAIRREGVDAPVDRLVDPAALLPRSTGSRWVPWSRPGEARVMTHPAVRQPVSFGWRRPLIVVPPGFASLPSDVQRAVLTHEYVHIARHDWLHLLGEQLARTLLWFQPAIWWALDQIQLAREQLVDEVVVRTAVGRGAYARALLTFADAPAPAPASALLQRRHLRRRIEALADGTTVSRRHLIATVTSLAIAASVVTANIAALNGAQREQPSYPGNGVSLPQVVREVKPSYTREAMAAKIQGRVTLACVVAATGEPEQIVVEQSLDRQYGLDDSAVAALEQWRFQPGRKDGRPVPVRVTIEMAFTLK
jgi:TonB family protein